MKFNINNEFAAMQTYFKTNFKVDIELDGDISDIEISDEILKKFGFDKYHEDYESYTQAIMHYLLNISSALNDDENHKAIFLTQAAVNNEDFCDSVYINTIAKILQYVGSIVDPENYKQPFGVNNYHPLIINSIDSYHINNHIKAKVCVDVGTFVYKMVGDDSLCDGGNELNAAEDLARSQGKIEDYLREFDNNYDNQREVLEKVNDALWAADIEFKEEEETPVETPVEEEEDLTIVVGKQPKPINVRCLFEYDLTEFHNFVFNYIQDEIVPGLDSVSDIENYLKTTIRSDCSSCSEENPFIDLLDRACDYVGKDKKMEFAFAFDTLHNNTLWDYIVECDRALKEVEID